MGKAIFITGTGTDMGKSALCLAVLNWAGARGLKAAYHKPVQCGSFPFGEPAVAHGDAEWISALSPKPVTTQVTFRFRAAVSPHLAAEMEGLAVDAGRIREDWKTLRDAHDLLVIEGAGGAAVPLNRAGLTLAAVAAEAEVPCLVAAAPGLGTLHHTLTTLAYLRALRADVAGFAFCRRASAADALEADNARTLRDLAGAEYFGALPFVAALAGPRRLSADVSETLCAPLRPALEAWWNRRPI